MYCRKGAEALPIAAPDARDERGEVDTTSAAWRFDRFTFDPHRCELRRNDDGKVIVLRPKAEALLRALVTHPRRLLGREELIATVWPHAVVTDDSLVQCIGELRVALEDRGQRLIRTMPRRGYVFEASVESLASAPRANAFLSPLRPSSLAPQAEAVRVPPPAQERRRSWPPRHLLARIAGRVTIDAQILDIARGQVVWTRQFADLDANNPEAFQEIGQHLANGLRNRGRRDDAPAGLLNETDPVELTLRGWRDLDRRKSMDDVFRARGRFESALHYDDESVVALNGLAATYQSERADPARHLTKAQIATHRALVDRARRLAPDDSTALLLWGILQIMEGRPDLALPALEKASHLVPSYPMGHVLIAQSLLLLGRLDEVQERADRAIARSTGDPRRESSAYAIAAEAALMLGQEERARELARHAVAAFPDNLYAHATLASIEALGGRQDLAAIELAALLRLWPRATITHFDDLRRSSNLAYVERRARLYEGLRLAGLPAGS